MNKLITIGFTCAVLFCGTVDAASPLGASFKLNATTGGTQQSPDVAMDANGNFVAVWDSIGQDGSLNGIIARRFNRYGTPLTAEIVVNTATRNRQLRPAVAMADDGRFVVVWAAGAHDRSPGISLWGRRFAANGTPLGDEFRLDDAGGRDAQPQPDVAMNAAGDFVAVWPETVSLFLGGLKSSNIVARRFAADGSATGASFVVASTSLTSLRMPQVSLNNAGQFAVAWNSDTVAGIVSGQLNAGLGIFSRSYNASGKSMSLSRGVAIPSSGDILDEPDIALRADGSSVVVWQRQQSDLTPAGLQFRLMSPYGLALSAITDVNAGAMQYGPAVASNRSGSFVIGAFGTSIAARDFTAFGTPSSAAKRLDQSTQPSNAMAPAVASNGNGRYVTVWQQYDGGQRDIFARLLQ